MDSNPRKAFWLFSLDYFLQEGEGGLESTSIDCVQSSGTLSDTHTLSLQGSAGIKSYIPGQRPGDSHQLRYNLGLVTHYSKKSDKHSYPRNPCPEALNHHDNEALLTHSQNEII